MTHLALALVLLAAGALYVLRPRLRRAPQLTCAQCGMPDPALGFTGDRCPPCRAREEQAEALCRERADRDYRAKTARWRAEDEARRLASRLPVLTVGSVYRNHAGEPVYEGFVFQGRQDADAPSTIAITGRHTRGSLVCGWKPAELHALAHGQACTCLD